MNVYLVMDNVLGGVVSVCATNDIAEKEITKQIEYWDSIKDGKFKAERKHYYIEEQEVINY